MLVKTRHWKEKQTRLVLGLSLSILHQVHHNRMMWLRELPYSIGMGMSHDESSLICPWLCKLLWCEAAQTATDIDNILVVEDECQPAYMKLYGSYAKYSRYLQTFGEMCVTAQHTKKKMKTKIDP